jgi:hypothetical protein
VADADGYGCGRAAAWAVLCSVHLALNDRPDLVFVLLALSALVPSCCVVPYLTLVTRKPFAAVGFAVFLVGGMKLLGCAVVVLIRGWDAGEHGHLTMPWTRPNLLVWLFWLNSGVLSLGCYCSGVRKCRARVGDAGEPASATDPTGG